MSLHHVKSEDAPEFMDAGHNSQEKTWNECSCPSCSRGLFSQPFLAVVADSGSGFYIRVGTADISSRDLRGKGGSQQIHIDPGALPESDWTLVFWTQDSGIAPILPFDLAWVFDLG